MTDPASKTVRGWIVELVSAVSAGANAELLAELRYLNQGLFGSTAQNPAQDPPNALWSNTFYAARPVEGGTQPLAKLIADALYISTTEEFGSDPRLLGIARLLQHNFYDNEYVPTREIFTSQVVALNQVLDYLANTPFSASQPLSENGIMGAIWQALYYGSQPGANGGPLTGRELLAAIAVATRDAADCCEGETPSGTYPHPSTLACEGYPKFIAAGEATISNDGIGVPVVWTDADPSGGAEVFTPLSLSLLMPEFDGGNWCVRFAYRSDEVDTSSGLGGGFSPYKVLTGVAGSRATLNYNGATQAIIGPTYYDDADGDNIGYAFNVSALAGNTIAYPVRFYVYSEELS